jgi:hypothetical protein
MTIYRFTTEVEACTERTFIVNSRREGDNVVFERETIGWWLTLRNHLGGHISWPLGTFPPEPLFTKGQKVTITIEAERPPNAVG